MRETIYKRYAKLLVNYSLGIKAGDKLLITSSYLAEGLLNEVYREALAVGAFPEFRVGMNGSERVFYETASDTQLEYISPCSKYVMENYDAILHVTAPFNLRELQSVAAEKKQKVSLAKTELNKVFFERSGCGDLRWTLCVFPTDAAAQESSMSLSEYEDFVYRACFLYEDDPVAKWQEMSDMQEKIVKVLNTKKKFRYVGPGTDISFSSEGRKWINSSGTHNMPSGEVFTCPVEDSVNGVVRFSYPGFYMGQEIEDIRLEVKDGVVTKADAAKGKELLEKLLEVPGARRFGEAAIGTNYGIQKFTKNMLFDEKIGGTIHMAIGASIPEAGGKNESAIHWDMLADMTDGGEIWADDECVYKDGKFVI